MIPFLSTVRQMGLAEKVSQCNKAKESEVAKKTLSYAVTRYGTRYTLHFQFSSGSVL